MMFEKRFIKLLEKAILESGPDYSGDLGNTSGPGGSLGNYNSVGGAFETGDTWNPDDYRLAWGLGSRKKSKKHKKRKKQEENESIVVQRRPLNKDL